MALAAPGAMATDPPLEPIVAPRLSPLAALRRRVVFGAGFLLGVGSVTALVHALARLSPPPTPPPAPPPPVAAGITIAPPIVLTIEKTIEAPEPGPPGAALRCPAIAGVDRAIGKAIDPTRLEADADPVMTVRAAARAPQLAVMRDGNVWISDDDGASFARAFEDHQARALAISPDGVVYILDTTRQLGVRTTDRKVRYRGISGFTDTDNEPRLATVGGDVVALIDDQVVVSADAGRSWTKLAAAWQWNEGRLFNFEGALYQVNHYVDMCGIDDLHTFRLGTNRRITNDVFHNYYIADEPVLRASSDVDPTWTWELRCYSSDYEKDGSELGRCAPRTKAAARREMLTAATLLPTEGARTLAVSGGGLIELCPGGARQIYRSYPFGRIDAVDSLGRVLVAQHERLLRWSPVHGWRQLRLPEPPDLGSD